MASSILRKMRISGRHMLRGQKFKFNEMSIFVGNWVNEKLKNQSMKIKIDSTPNSHPLEDPKDEI